MGGPREAGTHPRSRDLSHPECAGLRHPLQPRLCHPGGRTGNGSGLPVSSTGHRRSRRRWTRTGLPHHRHRSRAPALSAPRTLTARPSRRQRRRSPTQHRLRRRVHAVAWFGPVCGSIITVVALSSVAHSSGSGWVQAIGALLAAVLATGLAAPLFSARRAHVTCIQSPSDTVAGRSVPLTMMASGPIRIRPVVPSGPDARASGSARGPRQVGVEGAPERRGVLESVVVEVASSSPFGMLWWAKDVVVPLPRPLHMAPRLGAPGDAEVVTDDSAGEALGRIRSETGEARGIRQYQPGDLKRSVHWSATRSEEQT